MKSRIGITLLGLALLASCTQETGVEPVVEGQDIITLGVSNGATTRAAINDLQGLSDNPNVGIYGVATTATNANTSITSDWKSTGVTMIMKNVKTTAVDATSGLMSWDNVYNYPKAADAATNVKFFAYHPFAADGTTGDNYMTAPDNGVAPVLNFKLTGEEDLMWATPSMGSRTQPAGALKFNHQLTQLTFKLVDGEGNFTKTINSVQVAANTTAKMNIETGVISDWGNNTKIQVTSSGSANITMPGTANSEVVLPKTIMVQAGLKSFDITLKTDVDDLAAVVRPAGDQTFVAGKAYLITLRLTGNVPILAYAEVVPWVTGGTGEGVVE